MLRTTTRRVLAVLVAASLTVAAMIAVSVAGAAGSQTYYHHFCPLKPDQVRAAGPYTLR
jgi:hypothetical protein